MFALGSLNPPVFGACIELLQLWLNIRRLRSATAQACPPSFSEIHALAVVTGLGVDFVTSWLGAELGIQLDWQCEEPGNDFSSEWATILVEVTAYVKERVTRGCNLPNRRRKGEGPYQCTSKTCTYRTDNAHSWKRHRQIRQPICVYHCSGCRSASKNITTSARANYAEQFIECRIDRFKKHVDQKHPQAATDSIFKDSTIVMPIAQGLQCGFCGASFECAEGLQVAEQAAKQAAKDYENHVIDHFNRKKSNGIEWDVQADWREPWCDDEAGLGDSDDGDDQDQDRDEDQGNKEDDRHEDLDRHPDNHDHDEDFGNPGGIEELFPDLSGGARGDVTGYQSHLDGCAIPIRLQPTQDECQSETSSQETRSEMKALSDAQQSELTEEKSASLPPVFSPPARSVATLDSTDLVSSESSSTKSKPSHASGPQLDQKKAMRSRRPSCGCHSPSDSTSALEHKKSCPKSEKWEQEDPASYSWEKDLLFYMAEHPRGREISPSAYQSIEASMTYNPRPVKITYGGPNTSREPSSSSAPNSGHWH
ncbi:MAG: hypothetical protein M1822_003676 [Bathelium mastoideum]|nr:MAG: hypothetical protein M1822_003676 [Bathelium mastoideum]